MLSCACPLCHKALGAVVVRWVVYHNFVITVDEKGSLGVLNRLSVVNALEEDRVKAAHEAFSLARALLEEFVGRGFYLADVEQKAKNKLHTPLLSFVNFPLT